MEEDATDLKALRAEGNREYSQGNLNEAFTCYSRCIDKIYNRFSRLELTKELQNELLLASSNRAQVNLQLGHFALALEDADAALSLDPAHLKTLFRKAKALYGLGNHEDAVKCLEFAMRNHDGQEQLPQLQKDAIALLNKHGRMHAVEAEIQKLFCQADGYIQAVVDPKRLGSGRDGSLLVAPMCANKNCMNEAASWQQQVLCKACNLVSYCSSKCKRSHAKRHHTMCNMVPSSWKSSALACQSCHKEEPADSIFLWGNVPAISLLSPTKPYPQAADLRLCFAASGDLRDMLTTITQLPNSYSGRVTVFLNDHNSQLLIRNLIMLEMLRCYGKDALDCVIAIWYSNAMTPMQSMACQSAGWHVLKKCGYLERSAATIAACLTWSAQHGPDPLVAAFKGDLSTLYVDYEDTQWALLKKYLTNCDKQPSEIVAARLQRCMPGYALMEDEDFIPQPLRTAWYQFHLGSGLMLPFSSALDSQFTAGNMFLLHPGDGWMQNSAADPLFGWAYKDMQHASQEFGVPCEDMYGALFFHLRKLLLRFVEVLECTRVDIKLFGRDASLLAEELKRDSCVQRLHAISTSNIADSNYVGMQRVLCDWGPLLARYGTLLTMQMHWFMELPSHLTMGMVEDNVAKCIRRALEIRDEAEASIHSMANAAVQRLVDLESQERIKGPSANVKHTAAVYGWCTRTDIAYAKHLREHHIYQVAGQVGLKARIKHQFVPARLGIPLDASRAAAPKDHCSSLGELRLAIFSRNGFLERYVEWTTKHR